MFSISLSLKNNNFDASKILVSWATAPPEHPSKTTVNFFDIGPMIVVFDIEVKTTWIRIKE
jgi:hypothetical protein